MLNHLKFIIRVFDNPKGHPYCEVEDVVNNSRYPLSKEMLSGFAEDYSNTKKKDRKIKWKDFPPKNILLYTHDKIMWTEEEQIRHVIVAGKAVKVFCPKLFLFCDFRFKKVHILPFLDKEISEKTVLYNSPFPHSFGDGSFCHGNIKVPDYGGFGYYEDIIASAQDVAFNSGHSSTQGKNGLSVKEWSEFGKSLPKKFFLKTNLTIKSFFDDTYSGKFIGADLPF